MPGQQAHATMSSLGLKLSVPCSVHTAQALGGYGYSTEFLVIPEGVNFVHTVQENILIFCSFSHSIF